MIHWPRIFVHKWQTYTTHVQYLQDWKLFSENFSLLLIVQSWANMVKRRFITWLKRSWLAMILMCLVLNKAGRKESWKKKDNYIDPRFIKASSYRNVSHNICRKPCDHVIVWDRLLETLPRVQCLKEYWISNMNGATRMVDFSYWSCQKYVVHILFYFFSTIIIALLINKS